MFGRRKEPAVRVPGAQPAANAVERTVVDYLGDPVNDGRTRSLMLEVTGRAQGAGQVVYAGMDGDPSTTFTGHHSGVQSFAAAAAPAANASVYGDMLEATMEHGLVDEGDAYADPVRRMLAERLRRRR